MKKVAPAVIIAVSLAGCSLGGQKESVGTVGGAVAGGLIGSQIGGGTGKLVATGVGTLLGAFIGKQVGSSLDKADAGYAETAARQAYSAPVGDRITWQNPQSGNSGAVVTTREGYSNTGTYCREFQQTVVVQGRTEQAYGTACKQADGTWKIINNS
ncbi:surface antigen [Azospirillum picis]|uniref:17 kDa surface antigen n=1 Tax=Azospirillum picis TaxID=488438 RepID=A0ABU0MEK9_9PROT|nr:surface antigen [Azospirillum picis]